MVVKQLFVCVNQHMLHRYIEYNITKYEDFSALLKPSKFQTPVQRFK